MSAEAVYKPFMEGERLALRPLLPDDVGEEYSRWMNDPEVTEFLESRFWPASPEQLRAYVAQMTKNPQVVFFAVIEKETGKHVGNVKLGPIDWIHRFGDMGILIGDKSKWGKGYATETILLMTRYAFEKLNLHKVTASCYGNNLGSIRAFQKAGYEEEGRRKSQCFSQGRYVDLVCLGMIHPAGKETEKRDA